MKEIKINAIVNLFNCQEYIEQCLMSILTQKYSNYHIYLTNDASTDNSDAVIKNIIGGNNSKVTYVVNKTNVTALENIINVLNNHLEEDSIYCLIDADDFFARKRHF